MILYEKANHSYGMFLQQVFNLAAMMLLELAGADLDKDCLFMMVKKRREEQREGLGGKTMQKC